VPGAVVVVPALDAGVVAIAGLVVEVVVGGVLDVEEPQPAATSGLSTAVKRRARRKGE